MNAIFLARTTDGRYRVGLTNARTYFESAKYDDRQRLKRHMIDASLFVTYAKAYAEVRRIQDEHPDEILKVAEVELAPFDFTLLGWLE